MIKQAYALFNDERERGRFLDALTEGECREQALIVLKDRAEIGAFPKERPTKWQPPFVVRVVDRFRPGQHPLHDKGAYYVMDFSSVFAASAMLAIPEPPQWILDTCAAPGGKTVFAHRAFAPELIVCNEVIKKRASRLIENLRRCDVTGAAVSSCDTSVWAKKGVDKFDLVLVDAPCSGQSLLAKGDDAPGCFHPQMIDTNVGRQRRILGNAAQCVRPGGHLLYMTCTFSRKENEKVIEWLLAQYPEFEAVEVPALTEHRSGYSEHPCYRLFPQSGLGAGAFSCLLRRNGEPPAHREPLQDAPIFWRAGSPESSR